jgi:hypothetical protein
MQYVLTYKNRRLATRTEELIVEARSRDEAITVGNARMERFGHRLKQYRKPIVLPARGRP